MIRRRDRSVPRRRQAARDSAGVSMLELLLVIAVMSIVLSISVLQWREYTALQRVRYGTMQLASDVREAMERAKAERNAYVVTLHGASSAYSIARSAGGYVENTRLPDGVVASTSQVVLVSAFGKPVDALGTSIEYILAVQNSKGTGIVTVTPAGGVTFQEP